MFRVDVVVMLHREDAFAYMQDCQPRLPNIASIFGYFGVVIYMSLLMAYLHICVQTSPISYPHLEIYCTTLDMMFKSLGSASFRSLALAHVGSHRSMCLSVFGGSLVRPGLGGFVVGFLSWVGVGKLDTRY